MALDYHTYFPAVNLTRIDLFDRIDGLLKLSGMRFSGECMGLSWCQDDARYVFNYEEQKADNPRHAIQATGEWDGVMLEYDTRFGDRTVFFWKDVLSGGEVFGFDDTSGHFITLTEDEIGWRAFEEFIIDIALSLNASYALTMADPNYVTFTESELCDILDRLPDDPLKARPPLIVLRSQIKLNSTNVQSGSDDALSGEPDPPSWELVLDCEYAVPAGDTSDVTGRYATLLATMHDR